MIIQHPTKSHTHLTSVSLPDIQVDHIAEKVFILVADHDRNLRVVHNLLEVKKSFRQQAEPRRARSISVCLRWKKDIFRDAGTSTCPTAMMSSGPAI